MKGKRFLSAALATVVVLALAAGLGLAHEPASSPVGNAFTYQGRLKSEGTAYTGLCDFQLSLWDALTLGNQVGTTVTRTDVEVDDGYFTLLLSYGASAFQGEARWLDISVRCPAGSGSYVQLIPRQPLTPTPYALYAMGARWAGLTGVPAGFADGVDDDTTYTAGTGLSLVDTTFSADTAYLQRRVSGTCSSGNAIRVVNADGTVICQPVAGGGDAWLLAGNAGTTPGTDYLGTSDAVSLTLAVNGAPALRLYPDATSPSLIGGYSGNWLTSEVNGATIGGGGSPGYLNRVTDGYGTVGGGRNNQAGDDAGTISDALFGTVAGGDGNTASGDAAAVGGGRNNSAIDQHATVGGGYNNTAGSTNAAGELATVGGGGTNTASADAATVGGGSQNVAAGDYSTVGGGYQNSATWTYATVGGGYNNNAYGTESTVSGGEGNSADDYCTVGGGTDNHASENTTTIGGGASNNASGYGSTIGGGLTNTSSGWGSTVPGGELNLAHGQNSFAAGYHAHAYSEGCFVWGDNTNNGDVACHDDNRWVARASGGVYFYTNAYTTTGVYVAAGGSAWNVVSDRATKENLTPADGQAILETLASLPVQEYNLKSQDAAIRHISLVAQDFAAFGYGESDTAINMQDADGVTLAAVQALYQQVQTLQAENAELEARVAALEAAARSGGTPAQSGTRLPIPWLVAGGLVIAGGAIASGNRLATWRRGPGGGR